MRHARVVITGVGAVSPLGSSMDETWRRLVAGETALRDWPDLRAEGYRCSLGFRIDGLDGDPLRRGRTLAIAAAEQAVAAAGCRPSSQAGVYVGSTLGESAA